MLQDLHNHLPSAPITDGRMRSRLHAVHELLRVTRYFGCVLPFVLAQTL